MPGDRSKPPEGYAVEYDYNPSNITPIMLWSEHDSAKNKSATEAVAACWAHHDAIANRVRAEALAAVVEFVSRCRQGFDALNDTELVGAMDELEAQIRTLDTDNLLRQHDERIVCKALADAINGSEFYEETIRGAKAEGMKLAARRVREHVVLWSTVGATDTAQLLYSINVELRSEAERIRKGEE